MRTLTHIFSRHRIAFGLLVLFSFMLSHSAQSATPSSSLSQRTEHIWNNDWEFKKSDLANPLPWESVTLPHTWNADDMQLRVNDFYQGVAHYRKIFSVKASDKNKRFFVRFEGVGQVARVYLNEHFVGEHKGGYSAFVMELSPYLNWGRNNSLVVEVNNHERPDIIPVNHFLFGIYGGIYRPVTLITTADTHIHVPASASSNVIVHPLKVSETEAELELKTQIDTRRKISPTLRLQHTIRDASNRVVFSEHYRVHDLMSQASTRLTHQKKIVLTQPRLWNGLADPHLYRLETRLIDQNQLIDQVSTRFGVRDIQIRAGDGVYLNSKKIPMYGVNRHQDRLGKGNALSPADHDQDLAMIREMGATTVRFAHYQQSDYLYSRCDELGLLIWAEIPFVNFVTTQESDNAKSQLREMIEQSRNHPSIYIWGLHNEVYKPEEYTRNLTHELHVLAKQIDPSRPTVSVNGHGHMDHPVNRQADVQAMNRYYGWYSSKLNDLQTWASELAQKYPQEKVILAEYGADGNTNHHTELLGEQWDYQSPFYPEDFATKTHERHWGIISRNPYILASYVWNMFDFTVPLWDRGSVPARNMKGLVTYDRALRKDSFYWYKANWSTSPVLYIVGRRSIQRERKLTSVTVYSNQGAPTLSVNGQVQAPLTMGETAVHFIAKQVELQHGKNVIKASLPDGRSDEIVWIYEGENDNKQMFMNSR